ncbi:hypothetical protein E2C01_097186 [Portunus trituberculatus]|uniref:Uncharacterized protein n=1 Tax=Portunus trituberculatus TaxID=210409 RepID=A0A5B7K9B1_PORTR|nr:hypothetical protein [Portunus trituberculatus]
MLCPYPASLPLPLPLSLPCVLSYPLTTSQPTAHSFGDLSRWWVKDEGSGGPPVLEKTASAGQAGSGRMKEGSLVALSF